MLGSLRVVDGVPGVGVSCRQMPVGETRLRGATRQVACTACWLDKSKSGHSSRSIVILQIM